MSSDRDDACVISGLGTPPKPSWRIAEQYYRYRDFEVSTQANNDGYVLTIRLGFKTRRVFFDPAGRITHVRGVYNPPGNPKVALT